MDESKLKPVEINLSGLTDDELERFKKESEIKSVLALKQYREEQHVKLTRENRVRDGELIEKKAVLSQIIPLFKIYDDKITGLINSLPRRLKDQTPGKMKKIIESEIQKAREEIVMSLEGYSDGTEEN